MNVLSLFDGISCGQLALQRASIHVDNYFASEICQDAIKVTKSNFPNTIQLGDVRGVDCSALPKIDLLTGGSPCQGFSSSGKGLNFNDPRSLLFFEFLRIKEECKPTYFLLENVKMTKDNRDIISKYMGCEPVMIDSRSVSAQYRQRYYWTNIKIAPFPASSFNITLNDILERIDKKDAIYYVDGDISKLNTSLINKSNIRDLTFTPVNPGYHNGPLKIIGAIHRKGTCPFRGQTLSDPRPKGYIDFMEGSRVFSSKGVSPTLTQKGRIYVEIDGMIRTLTQVEHERLQTLPDHYTSVLGKTRAIKCLGNGWTVDVIAHIFSSLP